MKAMILAAGLGTRMSPLTDTTPKPLLKVGGKALIEWHLFNLVAAGIRDIVINHFHLGAQIEQALCDGSRYEARISYSRESVRLETAGGIIKALPMLEDENFVVVNADIWTDFDFARLQPLPDKILAHLIMVPNASHHPRGDFYRNKQSRLHHEGDTAEPRYTFSGISVLHRDLFAGYAEQPQALLPLLLATMKSGAVTGSLYTGQWWDIGTPERLQLLDQQLEY
jgi:N-acetyl-alpha-D-muramate 1-phosphate uridylyltransferase